MKNNKNSLSSRMKHNYEDRSKTYLIRRMPVIIRLDGKNFSTFTRGLHKPYDKVIMQTMQDTMQYLCENIQGCKIGYTQPDEITLLLTDYDTLTTDAWFDYGVQKMCSISASTATLAFNKFLEINSKTIIDSDRYIKKANIAIFDSRCFNIPKEEACNCFIWRQQDATRNAIEALGQKYFSSKELHKKSCSNIKDMLLTKAINFDSEIPEFKHGTCCYKKESKWTIDRNIPIFSDTREFIETWI